MKTIYSVPHRKGHRRTQVFCILILLLMMYLCFTDSTAATVTNSKVSASEEVMSAEAPTKLESIIKSDLDDDYWNLQNGVWSHIITSNNVFCREYSSIGEDIAQFRFQLQIPKGATIHEATITVYETADNGYVGAWIRRINETNVGPLESDTQVPTAVNESQAIYVFDCIENEWTTTDITQIVADQIRLPDWQAGFYIGLRFNLTGQRVARNSFEDFQSPETHHAYVAVSYTQNASWLSGWDFRKSSVIRQTPGAGTDYVIPINVSLGSGTDYGETVNLDGKALQDFADIRFTANDGRTPLDYYLDEIIGEQTKDYFTDVPVDFANFPGNYPSAYYYNGRTYVVFQGDLDREGSNLDPHIMYYDHASSTWSGVYYIGYSPCPLKEPQDDHGPPCLWVDNEGYINVLYGAHNYNIKYSRSQYPEDIRSWVVMPDPVTSDATYPHISYDPTHDVIHLIYRTQDPDSTFNLAYIQSTDKGLTWSAEQTILEFTTVYRWPLVGVTTFDIARQMLHFGVRYRNGTDTIENDEDIYYMRFDVTSRHLFTASGKDLGTKIDEIQELPFCKVYESGKNYVSGPEVHIDADGIPYLMFTEESTPEKTWFTYWDETKLQWVPLQQVSLPRTIAGGEDFIVHSPNNITAFVSDNQNIQRYSWDGSTWTWKEQIYDSKKQLSFSLVPKDYHDEVQVVFSEYEGVMTKQHERMYAWGSNGLVSGVIATHAEFYVRIPFNLGENDQVIYIYYGNQKATSESQTLQMIDGTKVLRGTWGIQETCNRNMSTNIETSLPYNQNTNDYLNVIVASLHGVPSLIGDSLLFVKDLIIQIVNGVFNWPRSLQ